MDESVQEEKEYFIKLFKLRTKSELNLQKLGDDLNQKEDVLSPYSSQVKDMKGMETTRTKKSGRTTHGVSCIKKSMFVEDKHDMERTLEHLDSIRSNMDLANKLIDEMRQFCQKIET